MEAMSATNNQPKEKKMNRNQIMASLENPSEAECSRINDRLELFHTSPNRIAEINSRGRFGSFLFFSCRAYSMSAREVITYKIEIDEEQIIPASRLFWHEDAEKLSNLVAELAERLGCDTDTAEELIEEKTSIFDVAGDLGLDAEDFGDLSWHIQHVSAKAARILGFRGVSLSDEQGTSYMIDMAGHSADLDEVQA